MKDALETVPYFLKQAAGLREGCPVVVTFYGGDGSRHLRWRKDADGGALPVIWDEALSQEVEGRLLRELEEGRQLGFTPWAQPLLASTDDYEEVCLGFKIGKNGVTYVGVSGRNVPAQGTALFQLGAQ